MRLIAEVEFKFNGKDLDCKVNTFFFVSYDSDSTRNSFVGWGTIVTKDDLPLELMFSDRKLIAVECIAYDPNASQRRSSITVAVEIVNNSSAHFYVKGQSIFFTGTSTIEC